MNQRFPKTERLSSKRLIDQLFDRKNEQVQSMFVYPFRVVWILGEKKEENEFPQILISVSKRPFKRAVDRNLLKRRIREAYRLNKELLISRVPESREENLSDSQLSDSSASRLTIGFLYVGKTIEDFSVIEKKMKVVLLKLCALSDGL